MLGTVPRKQLLLNALLLFFQPCHFPPQLLRATRSFSSEITSYSKENLSPHSLLVPNNHYVLRQLVPTDPTGLPGLFRSLTAFPSVLSFRQLFFPSRFLSVSPFVKVPT